MRLFVFARHGESSFNTWHRVNGDPRRVAPAELALEGRAILFHVEPSLDDIDVGLDEASLHVAADRLERRMEPQWAAA